MRAMLFYCYDLDKYHSHGRQKVGRTTDCLKLRPMDPVNVLYSINWTFYTNPKIWGVYKYRISKDRRHRLIRQSIPIRSLVSLLLLHCYLWLRVIPQSGFESLIKRRRDVCTYYLNINIKHAYSVHINSLSQQSLYSSSDLLQTSSVFC